MSDPQFQPAKHVSVFSSSRGDFNYANWLYAYDQEKKVLTVRDPRSGEDLRFSDASAGEAVSGTPLTTFEFRVEPLKN